MEAKGSVNQYVPYVSRDERKRPPPSDLVHREFRVLSPVFTIHLAAGTTPFMCEFHGIEYTSQSFRLTHTPLVTHGWYRPTDEEFAGLAPDVQDYVLLGGLLCGELSVAVARQVENDPATEKTTTEEFGDWCLKVYGRRPKGLAEIKQGGLSRLDRTDDPNYPK